MPEISEGHVNPHRELDTPRLRILELPTEVQGDDVTTPFVLVFDRVHDIDLADSLRTHAQALREETGARGSFVFETTIDIE